MVATNSKCSRKWCGRSVVVVACACVALLTGVSFTADQSLAQDAAAKKAEASRTQALSRRVEQLEEQLVDLQVVIGTLESLAKSGGQGGRTAFTSGRSASANGARVNGLETQIKALSAQVARLSSDMQALQSGGAVGPRVSGFNRQTPAPRTAGTSGSGFGATTVSPAARRDEIGNLIADARPSAGSRTGAYGNQGATGGAFAPAAVQDAPQANYEAAYGHLLQQNYSAAQAGFRGFLRDFPEHKLVPNALYWLGETYYVQQNYTDAAEAFDIVTAAYASSNKAPDSQLKRAMALANLGKRSEACSAFRTLAKRYPNAPDHVKSKADSERQRVGCT